MEKTEYECWRCGTKTQKLKCPIDGECLRQDEHDFKTCPARHMNHKEVEKFIVQPCVIKKVKAREKSFEF